MTFEQIKIPDDRYDHDDDFEVPAQIRRVSAIHALGDCRDHTPSPARVRTDVC
jgi:hypothetical protein